MNGSQRRRRRIKAFRNGAVDAAATSAPASDSERIVVHVHVHRDGETVAEVQSPRVSMVAAARSGRRRPTLSGELFDSKKHYDPVAKRHHEAITQKPPGAWEELARCVRQMRALFTTLAAALFMKRP